MRLQCCVIAILLIDEEAPWLVFMRVHDVHQASWLAARVGFELAKDVGHFVFVAWSGDPNNSQHNHVKSPIAFR